MDNVERNPDKTINNHCKEVYGKVVRRELTIEDMAPHQFLYIRDLLSPIHKTDSKDQRTMLSGGKLRRELTVEDMAPYQSDFFQDFHRERRKIL